MYAFRAGAAGLRQRRSPSTPRSRQVATRPRIRTRRALRVARRSARGGRTIPLATAAHRRAGMPATCAGPEVVPTNRRLANVRGRRDRPSADANATRDGRRGCDPVGRAPTPRESDTTPPWPSRSNPPGRDRERPPRAASDHQRGRPPAQADSRDAGTCLIHTPSTARAVARRVTFRRRRGIRSRRSASPRAGTHRGRSARSASRHPTQAPAAAATARWTPASGRAQGA
jgi:hypothetical protein